MPPAHRQEPPFESVIWKGGRSRNTPQGYALLREAYRWGLTSVLRYNRRSLHHVVLQAPAGFQTAQRFSPKVMHHKKTAIPIGIAGKMKDGRIKGAAEGRDGLAFLRKSHGGCGVPPAHRQEPPFESVIWNTIPIKNSHPGWDGCFLWWTITDSNR